MKARGHPVAASLARMRRVDSKPPAMGISISCRCVRVWEREMEECRIAGGFTAQKSAAGGGERERDVVAVGRAMKMSSKAVCFASSAASAPLTACATLVTPQLRRIEMATWRGGGRRKRKRPQARQRGRCRGGACFGLSDSCAVKISFKGNVAAPEG